MILLDEVVEILHLAEFTGGWKGARCFQLAQRFGIRGIFVDSDHAGSDRVRRRERLGEKTLGGLGIACGTQEKLQGASVRIDRSIQIHPDPFDFEVRLIDPRSIGCAFEMRSAAPVQFWCEMLHPPIDRGMVDVETSFPHHFFEVAVAERVAQIPAQAQENNLGFEVPPFERTRLAHEENSSARLDTAEFTTSSAFLATEPVEGCPLLSTRSALWDT